MAQYNRKLRSRTLSHTCNSKAEDNQSDNDTNHRSTQMPNSKHGVNLLGIIAIAIAMIGGAIEIGNYYRPELLTSIFNPLKPSLPKSVTIPSPKSTPTPKPSPTESPKNPVAQIPSPSLSDPSISPAQIYRKLRPAVVLIYAGNGQGSGTIADRNGTIITNEHVVRGQTQVIVKSTWGKTYRGIVTAVNVAADLAVVNIQSDRILPCANFETRPVEIGQTVYALGNPLGMESTFTNGMVSRIEGNGDVIHTTALAPGSSGSPLLDERGNAIAINKANRRDLAISISTPAAAIAGLATPPKCP